MKLLRIFFPVLFLLPLFTACNTPLDSLSDEEVVAGLREALSVGTNNSVNKAHQENGYLNNLNIKIPFPEDAEIVSSTLEGIGAGAIVDELVIKLNRAAEAAADEAGPIFLNAISSMTIQDGWDILIGVDDEATNYLRDRTYIDLYAAFKPDIENALAQVGADVAWATVTDTYNNIPFVMPVNTDLAAYTTEKALDGLFVLIAEEELKIREDPAARVTELLQKVFAEQD